MIHFYVRMCRTFVGNYKLDNEAEPDVDTSFIYDADTLRYEMDDYIDVISKRIYSDIREFIDASYVYEQVRDLFLSEKPEPQKYKFSIESDAVNAGISRIIVNIDTTRHVYSYTKVNSSTHSYIKIEYSVFPIDSNDLGYLVAEYIKIDSQNIISNCYHELFDVDSLPDAIAYMNEEQQQSDKSNYKYKSNFKIMPVSSPSVFESEWYKVHMEVNNIMRRYDIPRDQYRMISDLDFLSKKIRADSYGMLSFDDRCEIDNMICHILAPCISQSLFDDLCGGNIDNIDDADLEESANMFLMWALIDAKSEEEFNAVIDLLGPYAGRVDRLNENAYLHKGEGYVLVSKSGRIKWYSDVQAINNWYGSRDDYFHGKFMFNENPLPCFKGYHPEYFVDRFATQDEIKSYEQKFKESIWDSRRAHGEMRFRRYPTDDTIMCSGTWYVSGVENDNYVKDAKFFAFYFKYDLDSDQAKTLLNGEELVINDYKSKHNGIIRITVKLREATRYTEYVNCELYRPDQEVSARNSILMSIGAQEPDNPYQ